MGEFGLWLNFKRCLFARGRLQGLQKLTCVCIVDIDRGCAMLDCLCRALYRGYLREIGVCVGTSSG